MNVQTPVPICELETPLIIKNEDGVIYTFTHSYSSKDLDDNYYIGTMKPPEGLDSCCVAVAEAYKEDGKVHDEPLFCHDVMAYKKVLLDLKQNNSDKLKKHKNLFSVTSKSSFGYTVRSADHMLKFYEKVDNILPQLIDEYSEKFNKRFGIPKEDVKKKLEVQVKHIDFMPIDYLEDFGGYWFFLDNSIHIRDENDIDNLKTLLDHEFTHALTQGTEKGHRIFKDVFRCGFEQQQGKEPPKYRALNEGATEWIAAETTGRTTICYYFNVGMFKCIKDLVGEEKTVKAFLENNPNTVITSLSNTLNDNEYPHKMLALMDEWHKAQFYKNTAKKPAELRRQSQTIAVGFVAQLEKVVENMNTIDSSLADLNAIFNCVKNNSIFLNDNIVSSNGRNLKRIERLQNSIIEKYKEFGIDEKDILKKSQELSDIKIPSKKGFMKLGRWLR